MLRVSLNFLLDFGQFFNFLKTIQKGLKPRWECLEFILRVLASVIGAYVPVVFFLFFILTAKERHVRFVT